MELIKKDDGWVEIRGPISKPSLLQQSIPIDCERLSIVSQGFFSGEIAKSLSNFQGIRELWIWCDVGRTAMRHLLLLPNLEKVDLLCFRSPGRKIKGFGNANNLREFRCNHYMTPSDLYAITKSKSIEELGAQNAILDNKAIEAILEMPNLKRLNLEATALDDEMAFKVAGSTAITALDVGATNLTEKGFRKICRMKQLVSLDAWAVDISEKNLDELANLTNLEYLSIGGMENQETLTAAGVMSCLANVPSLKRIWLDGVAMSEAQAKYLNDRYEYVSLT